MACAALVKASAFILQQPGYLWQGVLERLSRSNAWGLRGTERLESRCCRTQTPTASPQSPCKRKGWFELCQGAGLRMGGNGGAPRQKPGQCIIHWPGFLSGTSHTPQGPELASHGRAEIVIILEICLLFQPLQSLTLLQRPPAEAGLVAAAGIMGTSGLAGKHRDAPSIAEFPDRRIPSRQQSRSGSLIYLPFYASKRAFATKGM